MKHMLIFGNLLWNRNDENRVFNREAFILLTNECACRLAIIDPTQI